MYSFSEKLLPYWITYYICPWKAELKCKQTYHNCLITYAINKLSDIYMFNMSCKSIRYDI